MMSISQQVNECSLELQHKLIEFMENGIKRRCKAIIISVHETIETFMILFASNVENEEEIKQYLMAKDIYDIMIKEATTMIQEKCEQGIDHKRVTKQNVTTWQRLQGYWLHHAPEITTKYLYIALLTNIADYFNDISMDIAININIAMPLKLDEIREFLKKKFIFNLITAHLQQHRQSNAKGPIIQFAAWKQYKLQQVITRHFDDSYHDQWDKWMQLNEKHNKIKKIRIDSIINQRFKPYSRESLKKYVERLQIQFEIKKDFKIRPREIEQFELFPSNIMEENNQCQTFHFDTDIMTISPSNELQEEHKNNNMSTFISPQYHYQPFISPQYINNMSYAPLRGATNTVKSIRNSPINCLKKENDKLRQEISKMKQLLSQRENEYVEHQQYGYLNDTIYPMVQSNYNNNNNYQQSQYW